MTGAPRRRADFACLALLALLPQGIAAQDTLPDPASPTHAYRLRAVAPHAHGTVVAVALRIPTGSKDDPEGFAGTAWLLGRVLEDQANRRLDPAEAVVTATVDRSTTVVTLLALPGAWREAWAHVDSVLFEAPLEADVLERHKQELRARMTFEAGSPFRDFEAQAASLLAEPGSPFTRPIQGTTASVPNVGVRTLDVHRSAFFRRDAAAQAVAGPVSDGAMPRGEPTPPAGDGMAWLTGERFSRIQDVTSTWISVAYPTPYALPRTHLELVAHLLDAALEPTPPPPDLYSLGVRIEETPRGPVLVVDASVYPEASAAWETRILSEVRRLAEEPVGEDFFHWRRRRFRASRLLEEAAPEAEVRRMTADLLRDGRARDLSAEIWSLDARALRAAARALGDPRILLLGPDLGANGGDLP